MLPLRSRRSRKARLLSLRLVALTAAALLAPAPVAAGFDVPNTCGAALAIAPDASWFYETIVAGTDEDWYKFTLGSAGWVMITLGNLPADDRLELYSACGTLLATSNRSGVQYEELYRALSAGTYRLRVTWVGGAFSSSRYAIRVRSLPNSVMILTSSGWEQYPSKPRIVGEVLNNTSQAREDVKIRIRFYDKANTLLMTGYTWARRERFGPHKRSMFVWANETIPGYDHYSVSIANAPVASVAPYAGLVVHPGGTLPDGYGGLTYEGTLENTTTHAVGIPRVLVTIYDRWGRVRNADFTDTDPDPMLAGSTNNYEVYFADRTTGNRVAIVSHGYRH
jgi:hypothetical protein